MWMQTASTARRCSLVEQPSLVVEFRRQNSSTFLFRRKPDHFKIRWKVRPVLDHWDVSVKDETIFGIFMKFLKNISHLNKPNCALYNFGSVKILKIREKSSLIKIKFQVKLLKTLVISDNKLKSSKKFENLNFIKCIIYANPCQTKLTSTASRKNETSNLPFWAL